MRHPGQQCKRRSASCGGCSGAHQHGGAQQYLFVRLVCTWNQYPVSTLFESLAGIPGYSSLAWQAVPAQ